MKLRLGARRPALDTPAVMGVLNVTPDSFSDGGRFVDADAAVARGRELAVEGAALVDVGGESTRPGAAPVDTAEELDRVLPVVRRLVAAGIAVSIDTSKPEVMQAAVDAGACMINDVTALGSPGALEVAAGCDAAVCLMHMLGSPRTMQDDPRYDDVVTEVVDYLRRRRDTCVAAGIAGERLVLDPGFGFGKTLAHNLRLLAGLKRLVALRQPVLVGLSRKSLLGRLLGRPVDQRLAGSLALAALAVREGAGLVRAHDVAGTVDAVRVAAAVAAAEEAADAS